MIDGTSNRGAVRTSSLFCVWLAFCSLLGAQTTQTIAAPFDKTIEVTPSTKWMDSGIDLHPGDALEISASTTGGSGDRACDPQGMAEAGAGGKLPLESALPGALIAKLQEKASAPVYVGAARRLKITEAGRLYFGVNLGSTSSCTGKYSVVIHVAPGAGNEVTGVKSKLASAAQIWLKGQLGGANGDATQNQSMASDANVSTAAATSTKSRPASRA